jgi:3-oxoacyl-[acyl-carrier-protein] synthase II
MNIKIAVTGAGCMTQNGTGLESLKKSFTETLKPADLTIFDVSHFKRKKAMTLNDFDFKTILGEKGLRNFNRNTLLILSVLKSAFEETMNSMSQKGKRLGLTIGTAFGSLQSISDYELEILDKGPRKINPMGFGNTVINSPASRANIWFQLKALSSTVSCGSISFAKALEFSFNQIANGNVDAMLCGGSEELNMQTFLGYYLNRFLDENDRIDPYQGKGTVLAEGCGIVLLEKYEEAVRENRDIMAVIKGYGTSFYSDSRRNTFHTAGIKKSIDLCLKDAGVKKEDVSLIITSANGIHSFDQMEQNALLEYFGESLKGIRLLPVKQFTGEMMGASGAFQFILPVLFKSINSLDGFYFYDFSEKKIKKSENNSLIFKNILINSVSECGNHSSILIDLN